MARRKTLASPPPSPDLTLNLSGNTMTSPDVTLYERGNLFVSADGQSKMVFRGNTIECFGVGGKGKTEIGSFITPSDPNVLQIELPMKPDIVLVTMHMNETTDTHCIYVNGVGSYWDLTPFEDHLYRIDPDGFETGIIEVNDNGFKFRTNADNTKNLNADYVAIKYTE